MERGRQLVGLRVAIWSVLLAALVGIGSTAQLNPLQRELAVNPSHSITDLAHFHPIHAARYGIYVDLRDVAPGATIILPPDHILDEPALESIAGATVRLVDYDSTTSATAVSIGEDSADRVGVFEGSGDHTGVFARYAIGPGGTGAERLRLWTLDETLIILPEPAMEATP